MELEIFFEMKSNWEFEQVLKEKESKQRILDWRFAVGIIFDWWYYIKIGGIGFEVWFKFWTSTLKVIA